MFTFWNELAIMLAHCILRGLLVETNKVIEKSGGLLVDVVVDDDVASEITETVLESMLATKTSPLAES